MNLSSHKSNLPFNFIVSVVSESAAAAAGDFDRRGDLEEDAQRSRGAGDLDRRRGLRRGERERRGLRLLRRGERAWRELDLSLLSRDRRGEAYRDGQGKDDYFEPCSEAGLAKRFCGRGGKLTHIPRLDCTYMHQLKLK